MPKQKEMTVNEAVKYFEDFANRMMGSFYFSSYERDKFLRALAVLKEQGKEYLDLIAKYRKELTGLKIALKEKEGWSEKRINDLLVYKSCP